MHASSLLDPSGSSTIWTSWRKALVYKTIHFKDWSAAAKRRSPSRRLPLADLAEYAIEAADIALKL
jgi:hypothetical protein